MNFKAKSRKKFYDFAKNKKKEKSDSNYENTCHLILILSSLKVVV